MSLIHSLENIKDEIPGFAYIKPENLATPELMAEDLENQFNKGNEIDTFNRWLKDLVNAGMELKPDQPDHIEALSENEQKRRKELRHEVFLNISKAKWARVQYKDHAFDDFGCRYFVEGIMKYTKDEAGDKEYNKKVHDYIQMAIKGDFKPDSPAMKDPEVQKMRNEFIQMHRDYLEKAIAFDMEEAIKEDLSMEFCAKHAGEIYTSSLVELQFQNIRSNFAKWGIEDEECTKLMKKQESCGNFLDMAVRKVSAMSSSAFPYMSLDDGNYLWQIAGMAPDMPETSQYFNAYADEVHGFDDCALSGEVQAVLDMFEQGGFDRRDVEIIKPGSDKDNPEYIDAWPDSKRYFDNTRDFVFTVKSYHDIQVPVHLDTNMGLTKALILKSLKGIEPQNPEVLNEYQAIQQTVTKLKSAYKKYVPVKKTDEDPTVISRQVAKNMNYYYTHQDFGGFFAKVREISTFDSEKRQNEFVKMRKAHNDIQPMCSPETYDAFFKGRLTGFRTITDPKEIKERQRIHDLAWDEFQNYAQKVLPINLPYKYPKGIDRFAQALFFGLQKPEDKQKLYELTSKNGNPADGDPEMRQQYATLIKHSIDYMIKLQGQLERINNLDDEEFIKKIMPYMGLVSYMSAADDGLRIEGVSDGYDQDTIERVKSLNSVGAKSMDKIQRILDTHYPAMTFKSAADMTYSELNISNSVVNEADGKTVNGILGLDLLTADVHWLNNALSKGLFSINPIVNDKINAAVGMDIESDSSFCHIVDKDGKRLPNISDVGIALDKGEIVYVQTRKDLKKGWHSTELIPIYCGGSIKDNKVLAGDEALKQAALDNKDKTYSAEEELKKYDQAHPKPTIGWFDNLIASVVSAVTFNNYETTAWGKYRQDTDEWERAREAAKEEYTIKQEKIDSIKSGKIPKTAKDKLKEYRNENETDYQNQIKNFENKIKTEEKNIIDRFVTDESKLNINASIRKINETQSKGPLKDLAKGIAEVIAATAVQEKLSKYVGDKKFAEKYANITNSFNKKDEVSKIMKSGEFTEFFKQYRKKDNQKINSIDDAKNVYQDYLKVSATMQQKNQQLAGKKVQQLDEQKPQVEMQKLN